MICCCSLAGTKACENCMANKTSNSQSPHVSYTLEELIKKYKFRDATPEEQKHIDDYIESISTDTGINIYDFYNKI